MAKRENVSVRHYLVNIVSMAWLRQRVVILLGTGLLTVVAQGLPAQDNNEGDAGVEPNWTRARQALEAGDSQMAAARFEEAEKSLRLAVASAPVDSELKGEAESALYLELPGLVVQNLISIGQVEEARAVLGRAINIAAEHPQFMQQLTAMEADLNKGNFLEVGIPLVEVDGRAVIDAVNEVLREHRRVLGRYPSSLQEMNRLLPPGESPLQQFFISRYRTTGAGYQLELTNLTNRQQVLNIDHTGLLR